MQYKSVFRHMAIIAPQADAFAKTFGDTSKESIILSFNLIRAIKRRRVCLFLKNFNIQQLSCYKFNDATVSLRVSASKLSAYAKLIVASKSPCFVPQSKRLPSNS